METGKKNRMITMLQEEVERRVGIPLRSPKDFKALMRALPKEEPLSMSTLKRVWQYVPNGHAPRESTLSVLARFTGFEDWYDFCLRHEEGSNSAFLPNIDVERDLATGDELELTWQPDRRLRIRLTAACRFVVVSAERCKLQQGDTFHTAWLTAGQPLIATQVMRQGCSLPDYVAGKRDGISIANGNGST